jgi:hypothetical protein
MLSLLLPKVFARRKIYLHFSVVLAPEPAESEHGEIAFVKQRARNSPSVFYANDNEESFAFESLSNLPFKGFKTVSNINIYYRDIKTLGCRVNLSFRREFAAFRY